MSRPSFLRVGDIAINVDQIRMVQDHGDAAIRVWFAGLSNDGYGHADIPITLDQFEQTLRDAGRDVATVDGAA